MLNDDNGTGRMHTITELTREVHLYVIHHILQTGFWSYFKVLGGLKPSEKYLEQFTQDISKSNSKKSANNDYIGSVMQNF